MIVDKRKKPAQDGRTVFANAVVLELVANPRPQVPQVGGGSQGFFERKQPRFMPYQPLVFY